MSKVQQKQAKKRKEVLIKVMEILKEKPFEEISVQDICAASGISIGTFYHYFGQKTALLIGLMGLIDDYMIAQVFPNLTSQSAYENLIILSKGFAAYVDENGIEISKLISRSYPTDYSLDQEKRPLYRKLAEIIAAGRQSGEFNKVFTAEKTADLILIAMSGVAVDWSRRDAAYSIEERMDEFTQLFLPALRFKE